MRSRFTCDTFNSRSDFLIHDKSYYFSRPQRITDQITPKNNQYCYQVCEAIRLYFGYLGNLQERVPELAAFWMVTLVLQLPLCLLSLLNTDANLLPLEVGIT